MSERDYEQACDLELIKAIYEQARTYKDDDDLWTAENSKDFGRFVIEKMNENEEIFKMIIKKCPLCDREVSRLRKLTGVCGKCSNIINRQVGKGEIGNPSNTNITEDKPSEEVKEGWI